jgi:hypothetical protein
VNKTIRFANATEDFSGDDIQMPKSSMVVEKNGARFTKLPDSDFDFSRVLRALAEDDLFRAIEVAKTFKYEAPRAYATLAIARAVLDRAVGGDDRKEQVKKDRVNKNESKP